MRFFSFLVCLVGVLYGSSELNISYTALSLDYKEYEKGKLLDSESSNYRDITGLQLQYIYKRYFQNDFLVHFEMFYSFLEGNTLYKGSIQGSDQPYGTVEAVTTNRINDYGIKIKGIFIASYLVNLKGSLGIGYHKWERELSSIQKETYRWYPLEFSLGMVFRFDKNAKGNYNIDFLYAKGIQPEMKDSYTHLTFTLGSEYSYGVSLSYRYSLNQAVDCIIGYKYLVQKIEKSNIIALNPTTIAWEPKSKDTQQFIKIGLAYKF